MSHFERALQCQGALVLVTGKPGIGKSTFLTEAQGHLRDRGALVLEGRCRPGLPSYRPLLSVARAALDHLCQARGADEELITAVENLLEVLGGRPTLSLSPATVTPAATARQSIQASPEAHRIRLFDQMARLLRAVSEIRPTVVLIHDIDFADPATLDLLRYLGRVLVSSPELFRGRFRGLLLASAQRDSSLVPNATDPRWESSINTVSIDLDGLDANGVRAFLSSDEVVRRVLDSTGGDPQLLDALTSQEIVKKAAPSPLDGLGLAEQYALKVLAVFGRAIGPETLRLLTGQPHNRLVKVIAELSRRQVIEKVVVEGELRIGFAKAGDQAVVIRTLDPEEKRSIHQVIAAYLESQGDGELESCAEHLLLGECGDKAVDKALAAGQRLEIAFCFERSADLYEKALALTDREAVKLQLREKLCTIYEITGDLEHALQHAQRCREQRPKDPEVALRIAHLHLIRGNFAAARSELDQLQQQVEQPSSKAGVVLRARVLADLAWAQYMAGESESAIASARTGMDLLCGKGGADKGEAQARVKLSIQNTLGKIYQEAEDHEQARAHFLANLEWSRAAGLPSEEVRALVQLGQTCLLTSDYDSAEQWYLQARDLARTIGEHRFLGVCLQHLGVLSERRCDFATALELYQDAVAALKKVGHRSYLAWVGLDLGKLYLSLGDLARATAMADLADRLADSEPPVAMMINLELLRGRIAMHECRYQEANERFVRAQDLAAGAGQTERETRSLLDLATLLLEQDRAEDALALLLSEVGRPVQKTLHLKALLLGARIELTLEQVAPAKSRLAEALELCEALQDPESAWQVRYLLSIVATREGRHAEAKRLLLEASDGEQQVRARVPKDLCDTLTDQQMRVALNRTLGDGNGAINSEKRVKEEPGGKSCGCSRRGNGTSPRAGFAGIIGRHVRMQQVFEQIQKVAATDAQVLIRGESGTGKELIAEAIHRRSQRASKPLVKVNCGALVESLLLSELFGHERGAFTGALQRKKGRFEIANGGTIFLDEIGDISPKTQVALLRVLQNREFERVGGTVPIQVDVRIICATNRDLEEMVARGTFREDLYYRLKGLVLDVPPLRKRIDDIHLLAEHFLGRIAKERNSSAKRLSPEALKLLCTHTWPGNVRELENVLRSVSLFSDGMAIDVHDFEDYPELHAAAEQATLRVDDEEASSPTPYAKIRSEGLSLKDLKKQIEVECIVQALAEVDGNITRAAKLLGMKRPRLSQLIKEHEISAR